MNYHAVTIEDLPEAFAMLKKMRAEGLEWGDGYRPLGRQAIAKIIEGRMTEAADAHLERMAELEIADRRNGGYGRRLLTELGDVEIFVPRTRRFSPVKVIRAYARRSGDVDRMILGCFVLGLSTRKVAEALLPVLGRPISASTVSAVAKTLDAAVAAFHRRPLSNRYKALMLDGVVLSRKTGAGAVKRPVLVALGIRPDGRKEIIDYRLAASESAAEWEVFLTNLWERGLTGDSLDMICVDGGKGLLAALPFVFPNIPVQRCWAHKIRNLLNHVRIKDQSKVKKGLHAVMNASHEKAARSAAKNFANTWQATYPNVVTSLRNDLDDLLTCFRYNTIDERKKVRTTNAIERRFREVRRRTRPMGVFQDKTSMDRILFSLFTRENKSQGANKPFLLLTQNI
jgi:transposase-like protein